MTAARAGGSAGTGSVWQTEPVIYDAPALVTKRPKSSLGLVVQEVHDGLLSLGLTIYDGAAPDAESTAALLNTAWEEFWRSPTEYREWEETARGQLRRAS